MSESRRVATNIIASWGANLVKALVQLIMLPFMARLLGPAEMGLYALALPIVSLVMPLADAGMANSMAREPRTNRRVWSSAFWMLQLVAIVLAASVIAGSFVVSITARQPRLPPVIMGLSLLFPLLSFGVLPMARMIQKGRLVAPAMIDMTSNICGALIGGFCAWKGAGVWAMVSQYVSVYFFRALLLNVLEFEMPLFVMTLSGLQSHLRIGGAVTVSKVIEFAGRIAENSQVSRGLGAVALGTYGFAVQAARFLAEAVGNSIWANVYYKSLHAEPENLGDILIKMTRLLCVILMPASFLAAALAPRLLPMLLGHKWELAGWPLMIFCLSAPFTVVTTMTGAVLYSRGHARIPLLTSTFLAIGRFVAILGGTILHVGLLPICGCVGAISFIQCGIAYTLSQKPIGFQLVKLLRNVFWPIAAAAAGFGAALTLALWRSDLQTGVVAVVCFGLIYVLGQLIFDTKLFMRDLKVILGLVMRRRASVTQDVGN